MSTCIFCLRQTSSEPEEHIVPEGLIGDRLFRVSGPVRGVIANRRLVLRDGEVCKRCNSDLSKLDSKLQDELGPLKVFLNPVGTKRGRAAKYEGRGMRAEHRREGPYFALNAESHPITTHEGAVVPPVSRDGPIKIRPIERHGALVKFGFSFDMALKKKSIRALHKIAFEMLCLQAGSFEVIDRRYDPLREYILKGRGTRAVIMGAPSDPDNLGPEITLERVPVIAEWVATLKLGCTFFVDLSPENAFPNLVKEAVLSGKYALLRDSGGGRVADPKTL